jgi:hypothetical protein
MSKIRYVDADDTQVAFNNWLKQVCDWINCTNMVVVGGRGLAKTSDIVAERSLEIIFDMPGAAIACIADSYVNLQTNILPKIKEGWKRKGFHEGIHYVSKKEPPKEWKYLCQTIVDEWKYIITWFNGTIFFGGSLDRSSLLAGRSVVHIISDEAKYQPDKKIDKAFPILRGDITRFGRSPYFLGKTITTDMPNTSHGEYDWVLRFEKDMKPERIQLILQAYHHLNEARIERYNEEKGAARPDELKRLQHIIRLWEEKVRKARYGQTFFVNASSFVNIDILRLQYIEHLFASLDAEAFKSSVAGMNPGLSKDERFYMNLRESHFFTDGYDYQYYDAEGYEVATSLGLRYLNHKEKLEMGLDVGNMISLVVGQPDNAFYRILKNFYVLPPEWFRELADEVLDFFSQHDEREIDLYYDRSANNYRVQGQDHASKFKQCMEYRGDGSPTGWTVNLRSRGQGNITMETEYHFMIELLSEKNKYLPQLRIDKYNCRELKSSMELAPKGIKVNERTGVKTTIKVKKSEKLPTPRLPMESTNMSDASKYLLCRKEFLRKVASKRQSNLTGL